MKDVVSTNNVKAVKIYSNNDEILQKIGQILASAKSRKIYSILIDVELNAKEVAKLVDNQENPRLPNIIFHLEKMVDAGMLCVQIKQQRKNGHFLKYYKGVQSVLVVPPKFLEKANSSKILHKTFEQIFKLSIIGAGIFITEFGYFFNLKKNLLTTTKSLMINIRQGHCFS